ncbi:TetR/AcrR family transcriptional regulator [Amycolatopsis jejuensis]|uniref:TetR/AcrR family transcriptional regulator n=1 Tax=Amycolatopsis jejuensis TaxID=330084 RepID=UPI00068EAC62|nr:helix-turn-helix domain-containing protein [Amycolatopsis jejuensis]
MEAVLLDAAWDELAESGYATLTFDAVARRARTSRSVLYRRWTAKDAFVRDVMARAADRFPSPIPPPAPTARPEVGAMGEKVLISTKTSLPIDEVLATLDDLVRTGQIRYLGVSSFSGWQLMKSLAVADRRHLPRHAAHQVSYSLARGKPNSSFRTAEPGGAAPVRTAPPPVTCQRWYQVWTPSSTSTETVASRVVVSRTFPVTLTVIPPLSAFFCFKATPPFDSSPPRTTSPAAARETRIRSPSKPSARPAPAGGVDAGQHHRQGGGDRAFAVASAGHGHCR